MALSTDNGRATGAAGRTLAVGLCLVGFGACAKVENPIDIQDLTGSVRFADCDLNTDYLVSAASRDGIQAIDDPAWERADQSIPAYLDPDSRVIGLEAFGLSYAIPHNMLWWHEVVNFAPGGPNGPKIAVTYCPLTGSGVVFERASLGGVSLGVSGIVFMNNLVLFDRSGPDESLWPQLMGEARCGNRIGADLTRFPFVEMRWAEWLALHPETRVLSEDQDIDRFLGAQGDIDYTEFGYPYGTYRETEAFWRESTTMPPIDRRRFAKERVVGLPASDSDPGIAFPFGALTEREGTVQAVDFEYEGAGAVLLWSDAAQGGGAFRPVTESGQAVTVQATASGFEDAETGSSWTVDGRAVAGSLVGDRLVPVEATHTAFWGAWGAFNPTTRLWE